jgi:hypothetical protein
MTDNKFERCEESDPNRCQNMSGKGGQCPYKAIENQKYCPRHIASHTRGDERKRIAQYRLEKYQHRMEDFAFNAEIKNLREEIGITRVVLEEVVNQCKDGSQILMMSNKISDLVMKINALVASCHKMEKSTGNLLDKTTLINLASQMLDIIKRHIDDVDVMDVIAEDILTLISDSKNEDE